MNTKKIFFLLLLLAGELLLIVSFLYFGRNLDSKLLVLNIIVSTIVYLLFFMELIFPIAHPKDESYKSLGSLGVRSYLTILYRIAAVGVMLYFNLVHPLEINSQVIIHTGLVFLLMASLYFSYISSEKIQEVYSHEKRYLVTITEMKKAASDIQHQFEQIKSVPQVLTTSLASLQDDLRYLSPSNNIDAYTLDRSFLEEIGSVRLALFSQPVNYDRIILNLENCERILRERKQIFSN